MVATLVSLAWPPLTWLRKYAITHLPFDFCTLPITPAAWLRPFLLLDTARIPDICLFFYTFFFTHFEARKLYTQKYIILHLLEIFYTCAAGGTGDKY